MNTPSDNLKNFAPYIVIVALLLWALNPSNPYGYYSIMRWIVCGSFSFLAVNAYGRAQHHWVWVWAIAAGIYNPIVPLHASRELWSIVNVLTVVAVAFGAVVNRKSVEPLPKQPS